jgi:ABC-type phosphate/phosphonate transport system substrate-binding protein
MMRHAPIASLPMYDHPSIAEANDALWRKIAEALRDQGVEAPERLTRGGDPPSLSRHPGLVFSQTCGYPFMTALRDAVVLVATPEYDFPGCEGPTHRSFLVKRADDLRRDLAAFRGSKAAVNAPDSNTGMNLFRATIAPIAGGAAFFSSVVMTGAHARSLEAVARREADLAAIDCVTFALIARARPELVDAIAILAESPLSPALPFIMSAALPPSTVAATREALFAALADPELAGARAALGLKGARVLTPADYERVIDIEREAQAAGYSRLA